MERARIEEVPQPATTSPADVLRPLSEVLGTTDLAINYFELAPGESFGYDYHRHLDQEEVFYVQRGRAVFETEAGDVEVGAGEAIRFAPGEFQLGRNEGDERVVALALGAPRESTEIEYLRPCPTCDERTVQTPELREAERTVVVRCTECGEPADEISF